MNQLENEILRSERLCLKRVVQSDKQMVYRGLSDPQLTRFMPIHFHHPEEIQEQMDFYSKHHRMGTGYFWSIFPAAGEEGCGVAGIYDIDSHHQRGELGFWVLRDFWGRGIATEALSLIIDFCFYSLNLNRICAYVESPNIASVKILSKLGFKLEGHLREAEKNREGRWIDLLLYSLLKREWKTVS